MQCESNQDCAAGAHPICDGTTAHCVDCESDGDCKSKNTPRCFLGAHTCVACLATSDCPSGQICSPQNFTCGAGCTSNAQCNGATPVCDTGSGACVACMTDTDCTKGNLKHCDTQTHVCGP